MSAIAGGATSLSLPRGYSGNVRGGPAWGKDDRTTLVGQKRRDGECDDITVARLSRERRRSRAAK
jgi:hypothetical protein